MKQNQEIFLISSPMSLLGVDPWGQTGSSLRETALKWEKHGFPWLSTNASAQTHSKALQTQPVTKERWQSTP